LKPAGSGRNTFKGYPRKESERVLLSHSHSHSISWADTLQPRQIVKRTTDWLYEKSKLFATPLFLLIIITRAFYGKFSWIDAGYILAYTFIYLPSLKK
jgi:hypothetical protein